MKGRCFKVWKKKIAVALSMAFLTSSLAFGSTASAYIINVGMEDLAATDQAVHVNKKQEKGKEDKSVKESENKIRKSSMMSVQHEKIEDTSPSAQNIKKEEMKSVKKKDMAQSIKGNNDSGKEKKHPEKERFQEIFRDDSFIYYMDTRSARNVPIPNRQDRMIDVWVKLKPNSSSDDADAKTGKYYLEHYYINPKSKQIQFLCELEVTGRPSNAIKERPYSSQNWENLVPGSVEDDIYHAVVKKVKSSSSIGGLTVPSASDILDMLNIGL